MTLPLNAHEHRKDNCFDFLRLFAALTVVVIHSVEHLDRSFLWVTPGSRFWFRDGVPLFFILSGLLVYRSCERCLQANRPLWQFYFNRFLRVAPAIYAYVLVTVPFLLIIHTINLRAFKEPTFWAWLTSNVLLIPVYHPPLFKHFGVGVLNGSLWTIPSEVSFYLVVPLLFLFEKRVGYRGLFTFLILLSLTGLVILTRLSGSPEILVGKLYNVTFIPYFTFFTMGIFWLRMWHCVPQRADIALICLLFYSLIRFDPFNIGFGNRPLLNPIWGFPLSYAVVWFGYNAPRIFQRFTSIGDLSYGVYIWHMVVINSFLFFRLPEKLATLSTTILHLVVIIITLCLALLSWWLVEKRALRWKPFSTRSVDGQ